MLKLDTIDITKKVKTHKFVVKQTRESPYVVDDSCFIPISEAVKQLSRMPNNVGKTEINACYDFPNGKDNGKPIPLSRTHNFGDIAELSVAVNESRQQIQSEIDRAKKTKQMHDEIDLTISNMNNSSE